MFRKTTIPESDTSSVENKIHESTIGESQNIEACNADESPIDLFN